jgi:hypothetical protein
VINLHGRGAQMERDRRACVGIVKLDEPILQSDPVRLPLDNRSGLPRSDLGTQRRCQPYKEFLDPCRRLMAKVTCPFGTKDPISGRSRKAKV